LGQRNVAGSPAAAGAPQGAQVTLGTGDREIFENVTASIHDGDDHAGKVLTEQERAGHVNERDSIDAQSAGEKISNHRDEQT
jgi:hypothetical protein